MRTLSRWSVRGLLATAAAIAALLIPSVAHAYVVDVDYFKITANHVDFGEGNLGNITGRPTQDGRVEWDYTNGEYSPRLSGKVWINNSSGSCARVQMTYNWSGADLTFSDASWCAPSGATWYNYVGFAPFADASIVSVTVKLQFKEDPSDSWTTVGQSTWIPT